ncbi:coatomer subunit beta-like [Hyalella azteca]|uniref:Coatomer subunit beta n=2 Tax=Hyalella azteca TaxID=294128 RepID=A0A8B7NZX8_HYAAZ|nr:coatomer subunit beta-like [Hyalella azteca]
MELPCYTLLQGPSDSELPSEMLLRQNLEHGDVNVKIDALKKTIQLILSGEKLPGILMTVIRFVMPLEDHTIKKLLLVFWEIVPKTTPEGKLLQEMILICDAYRKDLSHPNEFIRGSTLRFLCKLKEPELLEPLMPTIRTCLEHRHSYVRRNAVLAIFTIYKNFEFLIPDAPELISNFLEGEQDMSCKRNAFMMLIHADQERALSYLATCIDQVNSFGDILQLVIVELIYKVCHANPGERSRFIRCIYNLLNSSSPAVRYEAAGTLLTLSSAPTAIKAAANCYIELIVKESDNNVKLIVLDRLLALRDVASQEKILQELAMDVLRILATPDLEVRRKTLNLGVELVTGRTVGEMVEVLKKEVGKTHNTGEHEDTGKYRQLLVRTLHSISIKFPEVAATIIPVLMEFLSDTNELAATDVLVFVREAIQRFPELRMQIIERLLSAMPTIRFVTVHRHTLWILGEYASTVDEITGVVSSIRSSLGELPIVESEMRKAAGEEVANEEEKMQQQVPTQHRVTADGTYATQFAFSAPGSKGTPTVDDRSPLRNYLMLGNFYLGSVIANTLAKMVFRYFLLETDAFAQNRFAGEAMLIMTSIVHLGKSGLSQKPMTDDDYDRIMLCLHVVSERSSILSEIFTAKCRDALSHMLTVKTEEEEEANKKKKSKEGGDGVNEHVDDHISFSHLMKSSQLSTTDDMFDLAMSKAVSGVKKEVMDLSTSKLSKVHQLTGFSDPVYAEAYVNINQYDIVLDVLMVNQTSDTLQNCTLELATMGDLKLVEKPQPLVLAPHDFCNIKANVKVTSTENGFIFGNIVYDIKGSTSDRNVVILNDIHIDIMDYIVPATCTDLEFRQMWMEFEWENKVTVATHMTELKGYLDYLCKSTNMKCLTPARALQGFGDYMAANLYARSIFGEDALANLSIETPLNSKDNSVVGHIRIRAKSQGMAVSLGDKINKVQKATLKTATA